PVGLRARATAAGGRLLPARAGERRRALAAPGRLVDRIHVVPRRDAHGALHLAAPHPARGLAALGRRARRRLRGAADRVRRTAAAPRAGAARVAPLGAAASRGGRGARRGPGDEDLLRGAVAGVDPGDAFLTQSFSMPRIVEGGLAARGRRFALVASRFNDLVATQLIEGALDCLRHHGAEDKDVTLVRVPGAFEIPQVARRLAVS